jgi:nucleoside-diphosphate-sugar epimerase
MGRARKLQRLKFIMTQTKPAHEPIASEEALIERLTRPSSALIAAIDQLKSPLVVLGAGGKMGPTLCLLAQRAAQAAQHELEIVAVSRFSDPQVRRELERRGIQTCRADLLDRSALANLPDSQNVISLLGLKFGTSQNPALTWAVNTLATANVVERYARSRIAALSTGNVYPLVPVATGGAMEDHPLTPLGEYANAAVARERILQFCAPRHSTAIAILRLSFAVELRYGVLVDIARKVWNGQPVDLSNGTVNWIWQGDANELILRSIPLASAPVEAWNLTHPKPLSVRQTALKFGAHFKKEVHFLATEQPDAYLANSEKLCARLGPPPTTEETVMAWIATWIERGGLHWNKPTHFEVRSGSY